jgi:hypothetical protein
VTDAVSKALDVRDGNMRGQASWDSYGQVKRQAKVFEEPSDVDGIGCSGAS